MKHKKQAKDKKPQTTRATKHEIPNDEGNKFSKELLTWMLKKKKKNNTQNEKRHIGKQ